MSRTLSCRRIAFSLIAVAVAALTFSSAAAAHHNRPHRVSDLRVTDTWTAAIGVAWSRAPGAVRYKLFRNGVRVARTHGRAHTFRHLRCARTYRLGVRSVDARGGTSHRRQVYGRTKGCPPANAQAPAVSGTAQQLQLLTGEPGSWRGAQPMDYVYQWQRCDAQGTGCVAIEGADDATYLPRWYDVDSTLRLEVEAANEHGVEEARSEATDPVLPRDSVPDPDPGPDPDPDPDPEPDPDPGQGACSVASTTGCVPGTTLQLVDAKFFCDRPLSSYGQLPLKVVVRFTPGRLFGENGAIDLYTGCAGDGNPNTIDLIVDVEGDGTTYGPGVDAFKVRQGAGYGAGIQLTGHVDCGPKFTPDQHQDGVQLQGGRDIAFVDFSVGDYANGRSTCQGAGGAFFYSRASGYIPTNIDVVRGRYIACNHSLYVGGGSSGDIVDASFRSGRTDGTDPVCVPYHGAPPCTGEGSQIDPDVALANVTCQRWNAAGDRWE